jgi:hypothetical protein
MNFFSKLFKNKSSEKLENRKSFEEIYSDLGMFEYFDDGFKITNEDFTRIIKWSEIDKICAYKKDVFAYDLVVMEIVCGEKALVINEQSPGWFQLVLKLNKVFETIPKGWEIEITQPAFKENYTVLYSKV